jgi:hypothetical protein
MNSDLKRAVDAAGNTAGNAADQAANAVQQAADKSAETVARAADAVSDAAASAADATGEAASSSAKSTRAALDELTQTVERLSNEAANSARTAWDSEQRKEIQDSVVKGLTGIAAAIEEQVKKLSDKEESKRLAAKLEETTDRITEQVKSSKTFQDIADGLVKGFSAAAVSLEKWLGQQEAAKRTGGDAAESATPSAVDDDGSQNIVIENRAALPPAAPAAPAADDDLHAPDSTVHF